MPHAFRSAALIEAEAAQKKIDRLRERWASTRESWFDGTPRSVERRIAWIDEVIATAKSTASRLYASTTGADAMSLLPQLRADRNRLASQLRELTGSDWEEQFGPGLKGEMWAPWREHGLINPDEPSFPNKADWGGPEGHGRGFVAPGGDNGFEDIPPEGMAARRDRSGRERITCPEDKHEYYASKLGQAAQEFIAGQNTTDREELLIRAQRLMNERTASWTVEAARSATQDFLEAVSDQSPRPVRTARVATAEVIEDFDDHLMFS